MNRGRPKKTAIEPTLKPIDAGRVGIPQPFVIATEWIQGTEDIEVVLVMLVLGRYRVVSAAEAIEDPDIIELKNRIEVSSRDANRSALDFQDNSVVTLPVRLVSAVLSRSGAEWRLSLPPVVIQTLRINEKLGNALLLMAGGYIEVWDPEEYRSSFRKPLDEIIG